MFEKNKKPKEKKPGFIKKLKTKIDELFKSDNLTFLGKIFMLTIYVVVLSVIGIGCFSLLNSSINVFLFIYGLKEVSCFLSINICLWLIFIFSFITAICLIAAEAFTISNGEVSLFEKEDKNEQSLYKR